MMIDLFLSKPIWSKDSDEFVELRVTLFDQLEKIIWGLMTSEGRSEARLWLCEALSGLTSITPNEKHDLFLSLLRCKPLNRDLAAQVLQMIFERRQREVGSILAKKSYRLEKFFEGHPRRISQWFSTFSTAGDSAHGKGAKALSQFSFANRDICWEELEWKGKHGQSPAIVATKPHYFLDLDVQRTVENFLENVPEFWSSAEFADSLKDGEILTIDKTFFVDFFINLLYEDNLKQVWEVIAEYLMEESFSYLCKHILIVLDERDLCAVFHMLHGFLSCRKQPVNFAHLSYWLEIVIRKCGDQVSLDQLFFINALFNKGRHLLRMVRSNENEEEKAKINDIMLSICTSTSTANSLVPIARDNFKSKTVQILKWLGLLSWSLFYRLSEEGHSYESWKELFVRNKIGFRKSDCYGLLELDGSSEDSEEGYCNRAKLKKRRSRKRRKKNPEDEFLHLDGLDDKFGLPSDSTRWMLSIDSYSTSWSLADLPEHISRHCLKEWMRTTFNG